MTEATPMHRGLFGRIPPGLVILALASLPGCPRDPLAEARSLEASGEQVAAAESYRESAKRDPANLAAWDGAIRLFCEELARVGECLSTLELELDLLGNVTRHTASYASALEQRARARLEQGMAADAQSDVERAMKVTPDRASLYVVRARSFLARGDKANAEKDLARARQLDSNQKEANELIELMRSEPKPEEPFGGTEPPEAN